MADLLCAFAFDACLYQPHAKDANDRHHNAAVSDQLPQRIGALRILPRCQHPADVLQRRLQICHPENHPAEQHHKPRVYITPKADFVQNFLKSDPFHNDEKSVQRAPCDERCRRAMP